MSPMPNAQRTMLFGNSANGREPDEKSVEGLSSHIVGPIVARDTQILEQYLPSTSGAANGTIASTHIAIQPNNSSGRQDQQRTIYQQLPVPAGRASPRDCDCRPNLPAELLEKVGPFLNALLGHYYDTIHLCYPVTEEDLILSLVQDRSMPPRSLLVNLIAYALFYWTNSSSAPPAHTLLPDQDVAWQAAVRANLADTQKGYLGTIIALCISVAGRGRPSGCLVNNTTSVARAVALSHSIALNHDSSAWKIGELEKRMRWKAWWGVLIQDRWFNFAQGTPPYICRGQYNVPPPTIELLTRGSGRALASAPASAPSVKHTRAAEVYIHFCKLTEIVGDVLPLIYHIRCGNDGSMAAEQTSRSEIELNRWVESRPAWLALHDFHNRPPVPGLLNLQLSYLAVRMLLRRIAWHEICQRESESESEPEPEPASSWLLACQAAAEDIVRFVTSLHSSDLASAFWLPYSAHHFTSAVILLLRCALQAGYATVRAQCMTSARVLVDCLKRYHQLYHWDLAELALPRSESALKKIEDFLPTTATTTPLIRTPEMDMDMSMNMTPTPNINLNLPAATAMGGVPFQMDRHVGAGAGADVGYIPETLLGQRVPEDAFVTSQGHRSIEKLFPDIFSEFTDTALFSGQPLFDSTSIDRLI